MEETKEPEKRIHLIKNAPDAGWQAQSKTIHPEPPSSQTSILESANELGYLSGDSAALSAYGSQNRPAWRKMQVMIENARGVKLSTRYSRLVFRCFSG